MKKNDIYFYERQRFRQWWVWLVIMGVNVIFFIGIIQQIKYDRSFGNNPMSDMGLIIVAIIVSLVTVIFLATTLHTYINKEGIFIKYSPFQFRYMFYDWNTIHVSYVRKYNPLREYGGWGIRSRGWKRASKAYSVSGNMGLQLIFKNGRKVLIGTNQPDYMETVLMKLDKMERMKDG